MGDPALKRSVLLPGGLTPVHGHGTAIDLPLLRDTAAAGPAA